MRRSEGVGEEDERELRSIMGSEEKEVVILEGNWLKDAVLYLTVETTVLTDQSEGQLI